MVTELSVYDASWLSYATPALHRTLSEICCAGRHNMHSTLFKNLIYLFSTCRGLTRATYILCTEHPRPKCLSRELNPGPPALQANTLCKEPFEGVIDCYSEPRLVLLSSPPSRDVASSWLGIVAEFDSDAEIFDRTHGGPNSPRGSQVLEPLLRVREQGARTSEPRENCITSGSPLCRGLTRATNILCIEPLRPKHLSRELNPGPPTLQANTLCKE